MCIQGSSGFEKSESGCDRRKDWIRLQLGRTTSDKESEMVDAEDARILSERYGNCNQQGGGNQEKGDDHQELDR